MELKTESELVQNHALCATLLWDFVSEFFLRAQRECGPRLPLVLPVLPMTLHRETMLALYSRRFEGGLHLALAEHRTIVVGLQERIESLEGQTMQALNITFAANLIGYDQDQGQLRPLQMSKLLGSESEEVRQMRNTARRLGYWFYSIGLEQLCSLLSIRL